MLSHVCRDFWMGIWISVLAIGCGNESTQQASGTKANTQPVKTNAVPPAGDSDASVSAEKLMTDFKANENEARKHYGNRPIEVTGIIKDTWFRSSRHSIVLETPAGTELDAHFKPDSLGKDANEIKGKKIKFRGKWGITNPDKGLLNLDDCELMSLEKAK